MYGSLAAYRVASAYVGDTNTRGDATLGEVVQREIVSIILAVVCLVVTMVVGGLVLMHTMCVLLRNRTTNEYLLRPYARGNPFDQGAAGNCISLCCHQRRRRSELPDMTEFVTSLHSGVSFEGKVVNLDF